MQFLSKQYQEEEKGHTQLMQSQYILIKINCIWVKELVSACVGVYLTLVRI